LDAARPAGTGRKVEFGLVGIIQFQAGKVANERLYWDHPVAAAGVGSAAQLLQLR
jgi:ketosteroid isomerase-like protein